MRKHFLLFIIFYCKVFASDLNIKTSAKAVVVIDQKSGKTLYEKNANDRFFPASLTKIASAYYVLETVSDISQMIKPSKEALVEIDPEKKHKGYDVLPYILESDGTKMYGLSPNQAVLLKDLLYGVMLISGNNAANVLAEAVSGSVLAFMEELNDFLKEKGLKNTCFKNPHGLHFPGHYSSADDLAILTRLAIENPTFKQIVKSTSYKAKGINHEIVQNNMLLHKDSKHYYQKAYGVKTGHTKKAGFNLIAAAKDDNRSLIGVVLGCEKKNSCYDDIIKLFDAFFSEKLVDEIIFPSNQVFEKDFIGAKNPAKIMLKDDLKVSYYPSINPKFEAFIEWTNVRLPIKEGQIVGNLIIKDQDEEVARACLYSQNNVDKKFFSWFKNLIH